MLWNVMATAEKLKALIEKFGAKVEDRFGAGDMNLRIELEQEAEFVDYCDQNEIKITLEG